MYYRLSTNPTTLDPALIVDVTGGTIAAKLFNGLVRLDKDLRVRPDIAKSWSVSRDGLSYRFNLRKDIKFHNKQYVTPYDFKYSFKRVLDPKTRSPNTWVFEKIEGAKDYLHGKADDVKGLRVIDDQTLEIRLEKPFSPFLNLLTMSAAYVVPEKEVNRWGLDFSSHPVGTGPFELKEWRPNRELRLDRQDSYFDKKPHINGIVYRIINEDLTAMTEFELGNLDVVAVPDAEFTTYRKAKKWKDLMVSMKGLNTYYLGLNCAKTPFN
ncbi:MAG TPA: ABC transporter substrate-binding protein, partial [Thermodesulfovibrionales bacterium]|nr:ABC transporter substrate-binding protein [Thermodesulfovibrionales bacterium]